MSNTNTAKLPPGKVNQVCTEWKVREDGALAYRLQNEEISEHYSGNKYRNALVREDFPKAKDEQLKEQQLAEEAAAVYHRMLAEQEEIDSQIARQLADKLQFEERQKRRALEIHDERLVRKLVQNDQHKKSATKHQQPSNSPEEFYKGEPLYVNNPLSISKTPVSPVSSGIMDRMLQEKRDEELARKLQEEEENKEETIINKDRMLAMEAQDKELAKLLQEKEKARARKARERSRQKNALKKQETGAVSTNEPPPRLSSVNEPNYLNPVEYLLPEDTYAYPVDGLPSGRKDVPRKYHSDNNYTTPESLNNEADDINYSLPIDVLPTLNNGEYLSEKVESPRRNSGPPPLYKSDVVRPNHLSLKHPLTELNKQPLAAESTNSRHSQSLSPSPGKLNIAMAVDPTYQRGAMSSSTSTCTSTTSSSAGQDFSDSNAPPYMPIQGQKRMMSLEKKQKKKNKDGGCKQQ